MDINISQNIVNQLLSVEKVSLPEIGSFTLHTNESIIHHQRTSISAPQYQLEFSEISDEIQSLITSIANDHKIKNDIAKKSLIKYTDYLKKEIEKNGKVKIHQLGILESIKGELIFEQAEDSIFSKINYSLPPVQLTPVVREIEKKEVVVQKIIEEKTSPSIIVPNQAEKTLPSFSEIKESQSFDYSGLKDWLIAGILTALIICCYHTCNFSKTPLSSEGNVISTIVDSSQNNTPSSGLISDTSNITTTQSQPTQCIIITGSFKKARLALRMQQKITNKGYEPFMERYGEFNRVGFKFNCESKDLAKYLNNIRKEFNIQAWYLDPPMEVPLN